jgi:RimJ/RimL family protein N-acetyltransferase
MRALRFDDLPQYSDLIRARSGEAVTVRFVEPGDAEELQAYFRSLSTRSRCNGFSVVATMQIDGLAAIVGEARYVLHTDTGGLEFGLSIDDRWQGHGIGGALLRNLECRAAALGATHLFGDTLRSNAAMIAVARKSGFGFAANPDDWKLVRFEKPIDTAPADIPCASWRIAAAGLASSATAPSAV